MKIKPEMFSQKCNGGRSEKNLLRTACLKNKRKNKRKKERASQFQNKCV